MCRNLSNTTVAAFAYSTICRLEISLFLKALGVSVGVLAIRSQDLNGLGCSPCICFARLASSPIEYGREGGAWCWGGGEEGALDVRRSAVLNLNLIDPCGARLVSTGVELAR